MYLKTILSYQKRKVFEKLTFLKERGGYLSGGTALALQMGHRTSQDFDFYSPEKFDGRLLIKDFYRHFSIEDIEEDVIEQDTLILSVQGVDISCFYYPYALIRPKVLISGVPVASVEDIAAMKVAAIVQRGTKRDFIDMYYLIQKMGLKKIIRLTKEKYPTFNVLTALRGLIYFVDAEKSTPATRSRRIRVFDSSYSWPRVKKYLRKEVKEYQLSLMKR
ncbi:nucleotidyl transferase AbiEii/AbiGii toxin family protein [Patescibacteria group bacterium AH-259-L05]|nr:nucleotidyl transferase AbiEii/AbiGii toxin family protein [Patescibacteria group bacterium AH-259-L05]